MPERLFTVGHSNRSWPAFLDVLREASIQTVVDVRRYPQSRRHPHFCQDAIVQALGKAGIGYRHLLDLGGYRDDTLRTSNSINEGWPEGFLRNYADYALTQEFRTALDGLLGSLVPYSAIMCAERDWRSCHRQIIGDYAIARGHEVAHIGGSHRLEPGTLTHFAVVRSDGTIMYGSDQPYFPFAFDRARRGKGE
jgi:uncharacterized protein (DUF488 family)